MNDGFWVIWIPGTGLLVCPPCSLSSQYLRNYFPSPTLALNKAWSIPAMHDVTWNQVVVLAVALLVALWAGWLD